MTPLPQGGKTGPACFPASTTVIVANGETPQGEALEALRRAGRVIACDGAYARLKALGIEPDRVVGDCDSLSAADREALGSRLVRVGEQETNDLAKAFAFACEGDGCDDASMRRSRRESPAIPAHGIETGEARHRAGAKIAIVGAGGGREDHLIGNVFRLVEFAGQAPDVAMLTNAGRFDVVNGERTFECVPGQAVSVFAPFPGSRLESSGLEWPLGGVDLSRLWSGTLNRTTGTSFTIKASAPAIVYRAWRSGDGTASPGA